jgi:hypothetical protein
LICFTTRATYPTHHAKVQATCEYCTCSSRLQSRTTGYLATGDCAICPCEQRKCSYIPVTGQLDLQLMHLLLVGLATGDQAFLDEDLVHPQRHQLHYLNPMAIARSVVTLLAVTTGVSLEARNVPAYRERAPIACTTMIV